MKPLALALLLSTAACSGGAISVDVAMPRAGGVSESGGVITMSPGLAVDADDTPVCERIEVKVFAGAPTAAAAPVATGRGLGTYDRTSASPRCSVLIVNLGPRADYHVQLSIPGRYFTSGRPDLVMPGQPPPAHTASLGPVAVADKQTTKLAATID